MHSHAQWNEILLALNSTLELDTKVETAVLYFPDALKIG